MTVTIKQNQIAVVLHVQVNAFSRWERELPKLSKDARFQGITKAKDRRQIFDDFCRNVAEEQKQAKQRKEQQRAVAEPAFRCVAWTLAWSMCSC